MNPERHENGEPFEAYEMFTIEIARGTKLATTQVVPMAPIPNEKEDLLAMSIAKSIFSLVFSTVMFVTIMPMLATGSAASQDEDATLKVMTYNIKHGQGNDECVDPPATPDVPPAVAQCAVDLERVADVIREQDPDIVAVQEVDRFWARSGDVDQAAELASVLEMDACYAPNLDHPADSHGSEPHQYGVLILSKSPIISCENTLFPFVEDWEQRGLLEARIEVEGIGEVAVLNSHYQAGRSGEEAEAVRQRTEQAELTAERIQSLDVPAVLMGDLNANPSDSDLASLLAADSGLQDAWTVGGDGGNGFTSSASPTEPATHRIDYIMASEEFGIVSTVVIVDETTMIASDHYPVVAELSVNPPGTPVATPIV